MRCRAPAPPSTTTSTTTPRPKMKIGDKVETMDIRLAGGRIKEEGRVEIRNCSSEQILSKSNHNFEATFFSKFCSNIDPDVQMVEAGH